VGQLRAYLQGIKRYPSSREARQMRPTGTVRVWLELGRSGNLLDAGIESGSGSMILDQEALRTVRSGQYPPMPQDAYAGKSSHRFVVPLEYVLAAVS
jgi:protein TonB